MILFDIDGTLVDSQNEIVAAQTDALAAHGLSPPSRERALSVVGLSLTEAFAVLVGPGGPLHSLAAAYKAAWADMRLRPGFRDTLFAGAQELIADLSALPQISLGIATGKSRAGVARILDAQHWTDVFATIQTADTHPSKPHPSMVEAAIVETGVIAHDTVVVGDTTYDMDMARAAGAQAIGVSWGYHPAEALATSGAAAIARDFDHLRSMLLNTPAPKIA